MEAHWNDQEARREDQQEAKREDLMVILNELSMTSSQPEDDQPDL